MMVSQSLKQPALKKSMVVNKSPVKPPGRARCRASNQDKYTGLANVDDSAMRIEQDFCQQLHVEGRPHAELCRFLSPFSRADSNVPDGKFMKIQCTTEDS
mmetsp:Transcript_23157/g.33948  ORF Transcript_23157/g.33948 Transcript_23157/m.33948 type:complete len:100 (+) Transcript_23157:141-440(+)